MQEINKRFSRYMAWATVFISCIQVFSGPSLGDMVNQSTLLFYFILPDRTEAGTYHIVMRNNFTFMLVLFSGLLFPEIMISQTYLYKRVMVVANNRKIQKNDDAHYLTFTSNGCYESDKNGYDLGAPFISFVKRENGLQCFHGGGFYGEGDYYFRPDRSRFNLMVGSTIHVYQREPSLRTTASLRQSKKQVPKSGGGGGFIPLPMPSLSVPSLSGGNNKTTRPCPSCKGSGKGQSSIYYPPNFTGSDEIYCTICGKIMSRHTHTQSSCPTCHGKGYVEY